MPRFDEYNFYEIGYSNEKLHLLVIIKTILTELIEET